MRLQVGDYVTGVLPHQLIDRGVGRVCEVLDDSYRVQWLYLQPEDAHRYTEANTYDWEHWELRQLDPQLVPYLLLGET